LPPGSRTDAGGARLSVLCVATGLCRDGDGLDRLSYGMGIGG